MPFGSTRHPRYQPSEDPNLLALLDTGSRTVTIFGKSWELHATDVLRVTAQENIELIESSVCFLVENGREVIYDAEHFFDGYDDQPDYASANTQSGSTRRRKMRRAMRHERGAIASRNSGRCAGSHG